jgi:hypothetical protein
VIHTAAAKIAFRNKDGGGHYDHVIDDPVYVEFKNFEGGEMLRWALYNIDAERKGHIPEGYIPAARRAEAVVRQIGWELDFSLGRAGLVQGGPEYSGS